MAFTTPKTWSVNELLTASNMNTYIRDNQNALKTPPTDYSDIMSNYSTTSTSWADIDASLSQSITTTGGMILIGFCATLNINNSSYNYYLGFNYNGTDVMMGKCNLANTHIGGFLYPAIGLTAGTYTIKPRWYVDSGGTVTLTGSSLRGVFWVREVS